LSRVEIGTWNADIGGIPYQANRELRRYVIGAEGGFGAADDTWSWDLTFTRNESLIWQHLYIPINAQYREALDAVAGPNGEPICRSTLTNPGNACVPYNILGVGTASAGALAYVNGEAWLDQTVAQDILDGAIHGEPFSTWAGPAAIAAGFTHRKEQGSGDSDAVSKINGYWAGNYKAINGSYKVTEVFAEAAIPLAEDGRWAKSFDLNAAVRRTDYSESGAVTTWKIGATYEPSEAVKLRATRSRDIRAGNLADLFQPGQTLTSTFSDPYFADRRSYTIFYTTLGNRSIKPEIGDTLDVGFVLQPRMLPRFTAAVDYWDIELKDAIATLGTSTVVNECLTGATNLCQYVHRDSAGLITNIDLVPVNLAEQNARGVDLEAAYRFDLGNADLSLRALHTRFLESSSFSGIQGAAWSDNLGVGTPDSRSLVSATYTRAKFSATLAARSMSDRVVSNNNIECTSGCPTSTTLNPTIEDNHVDGYTYLDFGARYDFTDQVQGYLSIVNLLNEDPAIIANGQGIGSQQRNLNETFYDLFGRVYRLGVRINF
jgi:iron complex outermembrane recepter protein